MRNLNEMKPDSPMLSGLEKQIDRMDRYRCAANPKLWLGYLKRHKARVREATRKK